MSTPDPKPFKLRRRAPAESIKKLFAPNGPEIDNSAMRRFLSNPLMIKASAIPYEMEEHEWQLLAADAEVMARDSAAALLRFFGTGPHVPDHIKDEFKRRALRLEEVPHV